ncbi:MAG: PIG-L family deacetylase [Nitrospirota bacterium]
MIYPETKGYAPPEAEKVLVLSPHPDDESLGCAGTITLYTQKGTEVCMVVFSQGEKLELGIDNMADVRRAETVSAARILGIKKIFFLEFPDEKLSEHKDRIKEELSKIIDETAADLILAPYPLDPHSDHKTVSEAALALMQGRHTFRIAFYEIYQPIRFNKLVDISSVIEKKEEAILTYRKSLLDIADIFWQSMEGLNRFRSFLVKKKGFYEAFWLIDRPVKKSEIVRWATFGYAEDAAEVFLSKLRVADKLMFELENAHGLIQKKDKEIAKLQDAVAEIRASLEKIEKEVLDKERERQELARMLALISDSTFWKVSKKLYRLRDRLLPDGTRRRASYNKAVKILKK